MAKTLGFQMRIGMGFDIHRFSAGRKLVLGGIEIPHNQGLAGHSDADVLLHAIMDAILGAAGLGDIGEWFSDQDEAYKNMSSEHMLAQVLTRVQKDGLRVNQVDTVVMSEQPKLTTFKQPIKQHLAKLLDVQDSCVNIKAKTFEKLGPIGEGLAMGAYAVVTLTTHHQ